ncbi:type II secretion system protein [Trichloromonas sp.]|uniref:type II secretion system protein n=1 Tax=Trichloromonas sp. TaxID=3069249 RepID=UPI003D81707A
MTTLRRIKSCSGFTLIELITVIVLVGILAAMGGAFISRPVEGYVALSRRVELVDSAEGALRRMQRDIREALPNSVRISGGGKTLELLHTSDGGRYRAQGPGDILDFSNPADTGFDILGTLNASPAAGSWLVIYNLSDQAATGNAYLANADNRFAVDVGASTVNYLQYLPKAPPAAFPLPSPYQRFFLVDTPVSYVCDLGANTLTRYDGYVISPAPVLGGGDLVARNVTGCDFSYQAGTSQRAGLVTLKLTIEEDSEKVQLLQQVHVVNSP